MYDESLLQEAMSKFFENEACIFTPTPGGVNNIVVQATLPSNSQSYILRVYNNGQNTYKVQYEHLILEKLHNMSLSFGIPKPIPSLTGTMYTPLSNGFEASLFEVIPGVAPKLTCSYEIGMACGELTRAFASIEVSLQPPTPPYYDLYKVHHSINKEMFLAEMQSSSCDSVRKSADYAVQEILALECLISDLLAKNLPMQLIHGDLQYDNVLALDGKVTGVLDYEFCAMDWRAMDIAICLSKYASEPDPLPYISNAIAGYCKFVTLTPTEIEVLADLVVLRILSNVVYFVGRALAGEDTMATLTMRLDAYVQRVNWLRAHRAEIVACFP